MKQFLALFLAVLMLLSMAACGGETPAPVETAPETTDPYVEPELSVTADIIKDGASDYVIVHDGTQGAINFANQLSIALAAYGPRLQVTGNEPAEGTPCILVGQVGEAGKLASKKLAWEFDFRMRLEENRLIFCAQNDISYHYLDEYVKREVFTGGSNSLTLSSQDDFMYSQSDLTDRTFADYLLEKTSYFPYEEHFTYEQFSNEDTTLPYRLYVPFNYNPENKYPILLNLHGAGLRGNNNQRQLMFIDEAMKNPNLTADECIIVFPQCPENEKWVDASWSLGSYSLDNTPESNEMKAVIELLGQLQEKYSVDEKRIYVMGFSMGGYGTWNALMNHPDLFAAGIPMCGAGDPSKAEILKDIPIWAVHGGLDPTVPVQGSRDMAQALEAIGAPDFHYTEIPTAEHDVWNYTYDSEEMFTWLLSRVKP